MCVSSAPSTLAGMLFGAAFVAMLGGCSRAPCPLAPQIGGSVGLPHRGVLTESRELPREGNGFQWLRNDDRHHGLPRFVDALERAAKNVATQKPGGVLAVGDLSSRGGGRLLPHLSHRTGRDVDLLFYVTTLDGAPMPSPGFIHFGPDGLAWDATSKRYLRLDIEREWLLVKSLIEDPEARVQWVFVSRNVRSMLIEWAAARNEPTATILRAMNVMAQPTPGGVHDDHLHVRTACSASEIARGCEPSGPTRDWLVEQAVAADEMTEAPVGELIAAITTPSEDAMIAGKSAFEGSGSGRTNDAKSAP